jgi:hypothetical protein
MSYRNAYPGSRVLAPLLSRDTWPAGGTVSAGSVPRFSSGGPVFLVSIARRSWDAAFTSLFRDSTARGLAYRPRGCARERGAMIIVGIGCGGALEPSGDRYGPLMTLANHDGGPRSFAALRVPGGGRGRLEKGVEADAAVYRFTVGGSWFGPCLDVLVDLQDGCFLCSSERGGRDHPS